MLRCAVNGRVASHVAKAIGISTGQLHRYMEGEGYPERNTLQRIVNYCGIPFTIKPEVK
jgi:DNA-binding phage protein